MGKKKNKLYVHKADRSDLNRGPTYCPPATKKSHHETSQQGRNHNFSSLFNGWKKLTLQQKILVTIAGLAAAGVSIWVIYQLMPIISEGVRHNPSKPPNFLGAMKLQSAHFRNQTHSVCPVEPSKGIDKSADIGSSIRPVTAAAKSEQREKAPEKVIPPSGVSPLHQEKLLKSAISQAKINIKPSYREETLGRPSGREWTRLMEGEISQIKKLLPQTMNPDLLLKILKDPTFSIELVAYNDGQLTGGGKFPGTQARYLPLANKVLIGSDTDTRDEERLSILRNEMHSVALRYTNYAKQTVSQRNLPEPQASIRTIIPAIQDNWKTDPALAQQHKKALNTGFARVEKFKTMLKDSTHIKQGSLAGENAKKELNKWLKVVKNYQPRIYTEEIPAELYRDFKKTFKRENGKIVMPLSSAPVYFVSERVSESGAIVRFNFLKSDTIKDRAIAFIRDVENYKRDVDAPGGYRAVEVVDKEEYVDAELSSFIQEIDPNILKFFFPEWCSYFSAYHKVEDYCQVEVIHMNGHRTKEG